MTTHVLTTTKKAKPAMDEIETQILDDCVLMGITLPEIPPFDMPRFTMPLNKINYGSLIAKAFYFYKKDKLCTQKT